VEEVHPKRRKLELEKERLNATKRLSKMPKQEPVPFRPKSIGAVKLQEEAPREEREDLELTKQLQDKITKQQREIEQIKLDLEREREAHLMSAKSNEEKMNIVKPSVTVGAVKYISLEELIRRLFFKKGAGLHLVFLEEEHRENRRFVDIVADLRKAVDIVIEDMLYNYRDENGDGDSIPRKAKEVVEDVTKLVSFRQDVKGIKNAFVRTCNDLGRLYSNKSKNEKSMEDWRVRFVDLQDNKPEDRMEPNPRLLDDMQTVKDLLTRDEETLNEVNAQKKERVASKNQVQDAVEDLQTYLRNKIGAVEEKRLRTLLRELKRTNKKLEHSTTFRNDGDISVTREELLRISNVIRVMILNYKALFRDYINSKEKDQVHPLVREPIRFLETGTNLQKKDLLAKSNQPREKIDVLKNFFYEGNDVELKEESDPYAVAELLKEYFKDLPQPLLTYKRYDEFDRVNDLQDNKVLEELRNSIEELPKVRRATLTALVGFLTHVARFAEENNLPPQRLAEIFGPLILRPFKAQ